MDYEYLDFQTRTVCDLVLIQFKGDKHLCSLWMDCPQIGLGTLSPREMLEEGLGDILIRTMWMHLKEKPSQH